MHFPLCFGYGGGRLWKYIDCIRLSTTWISVLVQMATKKAFDLFYVAKRSPRKTKLGTITHVCVDLIPHKSGVSMMQTTRKLITRAYVGKHINRYVTLRSPILHGWKLTVRHACSLMFITSNLLNNIHFTLRLHRIAPSRMKLSVDPPSHCNDRTTVLVKTFYRIILK